MKLSFNTIRVRDLDRALKFYQGVLGLSIARRFQAGSNQIVFLETGGAELELIAGPEGEGTVPGTNLSLGFDVDSLEQILAELERAGVSLYSGPINPNPHVRFALVKDPDGVLLQLTEHI